MYVARLPGFAHFPISLFILYCYYYKPVVAQRRVRSTLMLLFFFVPLLLCSFHFLALADSTGSNARG